MVSLLSGSARDDADARVQNALAPSGDAPTGLEGSGEGDPDAYIIIVISIAIGVIFYAHSITPTEIQMRDAFEHYLVDQTAQTVQFIQETGGLSAVERVKADGNDRFEIRAFRKLECQQARAKPGFDCTFNVDIDLANGMMHRAFEGRFYNTSVGTTFELVEQPARISFAGR